MRELERRMWKVERSGMKEGSVLVMWLKKEMESEGEVATLVKEWRIELGKRGKSEEE